LLIETHGFGEKKCVADAIDKLTSGYVALFGLSEISGLSPLCEQKLLSYVIDPAPTFGVPNAGLSGRSWTRARRDGSRPLTPYPSEHRRSVTFCNQHERLHCGPPFLGIVLCLGQFRDLERSVAQGDQRFPARQYDRTGPGLAPESWGLLLRSRMRTDTFVKAGSSVAISPFADMLRIVGSAP
jgi:hypothetical protein